MQEWNAPGEPREPPPPPPTLLASPSDVGPCIPRESGTEALAFAVKLDRDGRAESVGYYDAYADRPELSPRTAECIMGGLQSWRWLVMRGDRVVRM